MDKDTVLGFLRHVLTFGGGFLISSNMFDSATLDQGIAAVLTLIGIVWSVYDKKSRAPAP